MKKHILFIHSAGPQGNHAGSGDLVAYLQETLGTQYRVIHPKMPDPENPQYSRWKQQLENELTKLNGEIVLVGHSLGGSVLLKYVSEEKLPKPIVGICLVAAPFWGSSGWQSRDFALRSNRSTLNPVPRIILFHSRDDEVVPVAHLRQYAAIFPEARVRELDNRGHLFSNGCAELADAIKKLLEKPRMRKPLRSPRSLGA
ncbi:alpha/beta fold hydrolase [Larkinella harenae]